MSAIAELLTEDELAASIGRNIRLSRIGRQMAQEDLCARSGVSLQALKNLEAGKNVGLKTFLRAANALGMVGQILADTQPKPRTLDELERIERAKMGPVRMRRRRTQP